jgi:NAD(P)H-hydrate epimerase
MTNKLEQVAELLLQTGKAHHAAYFDVDGHDPDWPLWYAESLHPRLPELLGEELTISELVYLMIDLDRRYRAEESDSQWYIYYARELVEQDQDLGNNVSTAVYLRKSIPSLTTKQMIEVDRAMIEDYQISLTQMMENAGRNLAHLARSRFLDNDPRGKNIIVLAGTGGNGGGALVSARRLANYGANVAVVTTRSAESFKDVPAHQLAILRQMKIPIYQDDMLENETTGLDLIVDGIIGYSLRGAPQGSAAEMIRWANAQDVPVLALDVPSGVDGTSGMAYDPSIVATATMTLALPKTGLMADEVAPRVGELYLADISVPLELYDGPGLEIEVGSIFARNDIVRLR